MFDTRYGWSPERTASSARVRSSPRSIMPFHSRASARSRTISGTSGGFGGFGGARSGFFAGFETTSLRFLLPSPLGRRTKEAESANAALEADHNRITIEEASALLEAARAGEKIAAERARDFARAVLELDEIGRLALAVLDGGLFMGSRVVELAAAYLARVGEVSDTSQGDVEPGEVAS